MTKTPGIWVRLEDGQKESLILIAKCLPGNVSDHARQGIREYIERVVPTLPGAAAAQQTTAPLVLKNEVSA